MNLHVFVAMPFGTKEGIDYNKVYEEYISPALKSEGFEVFRADEEMRAGEIRTDMFQELLLADLVVVDLSIDNPNVWYELEVRRALRSRGVIRIKSDHNQMPLDVYTDRTLTYHIKDGAPDPATLETDKQTLANFAVVTCNSRHKSMYQILNYLQEPEWQPRKVFLFSGHMIDAPGRAEPRFPADKEKVACGAIAAKLDELEANDKDLALCGGACGGDLIFAEECLRRGLRLHVRIPFEEPEFLDKSVNFAGDDWRERFNAVKEDKNSKLIVMPEELGPTPKNANPYERNNLWLLYSALIWGAEIVNFIALWNRKTGDGKGGTKHMYDTVKKRSGETHIIDTTTLW